MIKPYKAFVIFAFLGSFASITVGQVQYIQCTYLLERWKINDLAGKVGCPFGEEGLGKPWLVETYSFDMKVGVVSDAAISKKYCHGQTEDINVKLSIHLDKLVFSEKLASDVLKRIYGEERRYAIDRKTLKTENGAQCKLLIVEGNKI